jgi:hypothetical protein
MTDRRPPKQKPVPQCLDVIERHPELNDVTYPRILELRPRAKRFIFDAEASRHLGHFIRDCGDLIIANQQFAVPPFETTYIQIELNETIGAIGKATTAQVYGDELVDSRGGYLMHKQWVYPIVTGEGARAGTWPSIFYYERDAPVRPGPIFDKPLVDNDPNDEWARAALLLGTTIEAVPDEATRLDIVRSTRIHLSTDKFKGAPQSVRDNLFYGAMGEFRYVWAALLLLNQKRAGVSFHDVPWQAALHKGKRKVFGAHSVVKIHLAPKETMRRMMRPSLHTPRAAHDVKGHFAHWNLRDGCAHAWPALPEVHDDAIPRWHCQLCNGLRVWRRDYTTGDASVGFVTNDYSVTR